MLVPNHNTSLDPQCTFIKGLMVSIRCIWGVLKGSWGVLEDTQERLDTQSVQLECHEGIRVQKPNVLYGFWGLVTQRRSNWILWERNAEQLQVDSDKENAGARVLLPRRLLSQLPSPPTVARVAFCTRLPDSCRALGPYLPVLDIRPHSSILGTE